MKNFILGSVLVVSTFFAAAPKAQADQWGCTIFICFASPTNPMAIADCAKAILQIRPWKKPTCDSVKVHFQRDVERFCPDGYQYIEGLEEFRKTSSSRSRTEVAVFGGEKFLGLDDVCINARTGETLAPNPYTVYEASYSAGGKLYNINYVYP